MDEALEFPTLAHAARQSLSPELHPPRYLSRRCPTCGTAFQPVSPRQRYCRSVCRAGPKPRRHLPIGMA